MSSDQPPAEPAQPVGTPEPAEPVATTEPAQPVASPEPAEPVAMPEPAAAVRTAEPAGPAGPAASPARPVRQRPPDASPWNWLLLVPIVIPLLTLLYNHDGPHFLDFPAFYWLQLLFVFLGVATTTTVYQMTKRRD